MVMPRGLFHLKGQRLSSVLVIAQFKLSIELMRFRGRNRAYQFVMIVAFGNQRQRFNRTARPANGDPRRSQRRASR